MQERKYIGLVGGGASAISFINEFTKMEKAPGKQIVIYVFDKSDYLGPGNAYGPRDVESNILNTKAGYITAINGKPGDFYAWYLDNQGDLLVEFPRLYGPDDYVPRALFGKYMKYSFRDRSKYALLNGIQVVNIHAEVVDLEPDGDVFQVKTRCGGSYAVDCVVLACGTLKADKDQVADDTIFNDPYPVKKVVNAIQREASVGIIGSRLGAIDTVIGLAEAGHQGKISIFSRSGYFPWVRGTQGRYECRYLNPAIIQELIDGLDRPLRLSDIGHLFVRELEYYRGNNEDQLEPLSFPPPPITCLAEHLSNELSLSLGPRGWQAIIYNTNSMLSLIWNSLDESEKDMFFNEYLSPAISMRVSIPRENAVKILELVNSGKVAFIVGDAVMTARDGRHFIECAGETFDVDYIVKAMGSPRRLAQTDSALFKNLLSKGIVEQHKYGGINVTHDNRVLDDRGRASSRLFATGEVTCGVNLFTSAMDIICTQAAKCARSCSQAIDESSMGVA
ncbi:FAD/NAD(P)-binding protein [Cedecea colo]|uniref:FAD-dependent urate hydroxylase HpyO/Asp monooxygenase CreE-like FAD/NAD(P)-binding domain-containing protein n=1 Tax=Cedecea colo TaxID=2552946 RepID=A0ABX0VNC6_9ENTR|nr:FAD/NAD(P)-binding protein [Cedecea colo]NIY48560.1 hypothetical protein [Cedecea colo]